MTISFKQYLKIISIILLFLLLIIGFFNYLIDPYTLYDSPIIRGVNLIKPEYQTHVRMIKANQIRRLKPSILLMGSSRAEVGLNPNYPEFRKHSKNVYNLALSSANIGEIYQYLQHAHYINSLNKVIIGLDFFMFNINKDNEPDFKQTRLEPQSIGWYKDLFQSLFTYDALLSSINTIQKQDSLPTAFYLSNGFNSDEYKWNNIQNIGGHYNATVKNESYALTAKDGYIFFSLYERNGYSHTLETFKKILIFCQTNNIELYLFISPAHARASVLIQEIGLWGQYETWKREMIKIIDEVDKSLYILDFSTINPITTEKFPEENDNTTKMNFYWESSHYKELIGNKILDSFFKNEQLHYNNFGEKLNNATIELALVSNRIKIKEYINLNKKIQKDIIKLIINTSSKRNITINKNPELQPLLLK